jgi:hypothetical protein
MHLPIRNCMAERGIPETDFYAHKLVGPSVVDASGVQYGSARNRIDSYGSDVPGCDPDFLLVTNCKQNETVSSFFCSHLQLRVFKSYKVR